MIVLEHLRDEAQRLELDVLCEVHSAEELKRANALGFDVIGVNSRDLRTFEMHPELLFGLVDSMPTKTVKVAESGLRNAEEIVLAARCGLRRLPDGRDADASADPGAALAAAAGARICRSRTAIDVDVAIDDLGEDLRQHEPRRCKARGRAWRRCPGIRTSPRASVMSPPAQVAAITRIFLPTWSAWCRREPRCLCDREDRS